MFSTKVFRHLRKALPDREFYVLGDTSYSECCVDDVNASHANANDLIVKFGPTCLSTSSKSKQSDKEFIYVIGTMSKDAPDKLKWLREDLPGQLSSFVSENAPSESAEANDKVFIYAEE